MAAGLAGKGAGSEGFALPEAAFSGSEGAVGAAEGGMGPRRSGRLVPPVTYTPEGSESDSGQEDEGEANVDYMWGIKNPDENPSHFGYRVRKQIKTYAELRGAIARGKLE